jgi:hypothetical protein
LLIKPLVYEEDFYFDDAVFLFGKNDESDRKICLSYGSESGYDQSCRYMKVETTFLDVRNNRSLFISESKLLRDSFENSFEAAGKPEIKKSKKDKPEFPKLANGKSIQPKLFEYFVQKITLIKR